MTTCPAACWRSRYKNSAGWTERQAHRGMARASGAPPLTRRCAAGHPEYQHPGPCSKNPPARVLWPRRAMAQPARRSGDGSGARPGVLQRRGQTAALLADQATKRALRVQARDAHSEGLRAGGAASERPYRASRSGPHNARPGMVGRGLALSGVGPAPPVAVGARDACTAGIRRRSAVVAVPAVLPRLVAVARAGDDRAGAGVAAPVPRGPSAYLVSIRPRTPCGTRPRR